MNTISEKAVKRFNIVFTFIIFGFLLLIIRIFNLSFKGLINNKEFKNLRVPVRGEILDRNYNKLASSIKVYSIFCNPKKISIDDVRKKKLLSLLGISESSFDKILRSDKNFVWLKRKVDYKTYREILNLNIDGIEFKEEYRRIYPNGSLCSTLLGIVGIDNVGLEGVEFYYDKYLNSGWTFSKDEKNFNIMLTIDKNIQYIVETSLKEAYLATKSDYATAIVMEPQTGEILAMASFPDFDPNNFENYSYENRQNRAISFSYEPGSIFKIFTVAAILSENVVKTNEYFYCPGYIKIADKKIACWDIHHRLSFKEVIKKSCNVGIINMIFRIPRLKLYEYYKLFNFGNYTGIDLPGEAKGFLKSFKNLPLFSKSSISIGQEVSATSLQLLTAACAIFNNGKMMQPHILKAILNSENSIYKEVQPILIREVIKEEIAKEIIEFLKGVVSEGGTGELAYIKGYSIAGKTGTGQIFDIKLKKYVENKVNASFIGFIPALNPKYGIIVSLHNPKTTDNTGGKVAAPVFKKIAEKLISYNPVPAEKVIISKEFYKIEIEEDEKIYNRNFLPNFEGKNIRQTLKILRSLNLKPNLIGSGIAYAQYPKPGTKIETNMVVTVYFKFPEIK